MAAADDPARPISLFYSYSHKDAALRAELDEHLVPLARVGLIEVWHDRDMLPGDSIDDEIAAKLRTVDIVLVLVSPSFIKSSYCYDIELTKAIERQKQGDARIVSVILRPCQWKLTPLKDLVALPSDGRPVTEWPNRDSAFNDVAGEVARLATALRQRRAPHPPADVGPSLSHSRERVGVRVLKDFEVFRDIGDGWSPEALWWPEMVVIPAGTFLMGSPPGEEGRYDDEGPQHRVTIGSRFALGRYPVTFDEYDHFCSATKREKPSDRGWGRGKRPAINVSWRDAVAYCEWLANETGEAYRLPTEAEWEYAARAGTTTRYWWGDAITPMIANYAQSKLAKTSEVGAYPPNPWGLYDLHGNAWEWVADVWHDSYQGAPFDGSAWTEGVGISSSTLRLNRGGSWYDDPRYLRSASRGRSDADDRYVNIGFRCARTL